MRDHSDPWKKTGKTYHSAKTVHLHMHLHLHSPLYRTSNPRGGPWEGPWGVSGPLGGPLGGQWAQNDHMMRIKMAQRGGCLWYGRAGGNGRGALGLSDVALDPHPYYLCIYTLAPGGSPGGTPRGGCAFRSRCGFFIVIFLGHRRGTRALGPNFDSRWGFTIVIFFRPFLSLHPLPSTDSLF